MTIVKICGITNLDDACCAVDAGADLLGFIFYPPSPRSVSVEVARAIAEVIRGRGAKIGHAPSAPILVGVFVNETPEHMLRTVKEAGLDAIQLSGNEPLVTLQALNGMGIKVVRKLHEAHAFGGLQANLVLPELVLEADHPTLYGGTGQRANEQLALQLARHYRLMLTGGLTPGNVAGVVQAVRPWGVDVASGVEASPGRKEHAKVRAFVAAVKQGPVAL
jgi:phosphoribosylanthranilate isomerase